MTAEDKIAGLQQAVEENFNCKASYRQTSRVTETFEGQPVWEDDVLIFTVKGIEDAKTAYAWFEVLEDGFFRVFTVLRRSPVKSANDAVRAALVHRYREESQA